MNSTGYSVVGYPIRACEKDYLLFWYILKRSHADLRGCYQASMDNTLIDLHNSSYPTLPYSLIAKYNSCKD